jgi:glycine/D-amino acid oxidase-like deaminating enzyme
MRLRTFESFWIIKNGLVHSYPSLQKNIRTEIVVVGGGITGALISHALLQEGYTVTLVDRRDIASGSTSATTSMLQYEIDVPLHELADMIGEPAAVLCYRSGIDAIRRLEKMVQSLNLDCGFKRKKSLYYAHSAVTEKKLKKEFTIRQKHRLGVRWINASTILKKYGIKSYGGILSEAAASMDAYQLAHALIQYNYNRGLKVFDQTDIKLHRSVKNGLKLTTADGYTIHCKKVIYCNGFEATEMLKEKVADLVYTYATVSEQGIQLKKLLDDTLIWNTSKPYLYMRTTADERFLIGGEDDAVKTPEEQQVLKDKKCRLLVKKLQKIMPGISFIADFNWGGVFGSTKDGLPYIGPSPEYENTLFALGFGGNGITFSVQAMEMIPAMLKKHEHPLAPYYRFGR